MRWSSTFLSVSLLAVAASVVARSSSALKLNNPQISLISSEGSTLQSHTLEPPHSLTTPLVLPPLSTFKLAFQVTDENGDGIIPHQAHLSFVDVETGKDEVLPLNVRAKGKTRFEIDTASPPSQLLSTTGTFTVTLNVGSLTASSISYPLLTLSLPSTVLTPQKAHVDTYSAELFSSFGKQKLIHHTFREDEKGVNALISLLGTGAVWAPWVVLAGLINSLSFKLVPQSVAYPFLTTLLALESTTLVYWIGYIKLFKFLAIFSILGATSFFTGRSALRGDTSK
ncbi:Oligosaccharyltransferase, delta subunit (ribophorin II) [Phaffia rhodozyma]|uniref:Ribophorin II n=1 Tax=Phaffia rhodozyma TaxID=264483 RepID=A0A0F7SF70_PHARH|nr:Oligosaccharyltransferase, delta subunit (ribophorin II) [Phaffia rhodozyma]